MKYLNKKFSVGSSLPCKNCDNKDSKKCEKCQESKWSWPNYKRQKKGETMRKLAVLVLCLCFMGAVYAEDPVAGDVTEVPVTNSVEVPEVSLNDLKAQVFDYILAQETIVREQKVLEQRKQAIQKKKEEVLKQIDEMEKS